MIPGNYCANISCQHQGLDCLLTCQYCKIRSYCSTNCQLQDWNMGHSKVCEANYQLHLEDIEKRCPFLTDGVLFSQGQTKGMRCKLETILSTYEKVKPPGRSTSIIGKGSYGEVFLMRNKSTGKYVALKAIKKQFIGNPGMLKGLMKEIEIHKTLMHDNIIQLIEHCEDSKNIYIVMEYAGKGSLFKHIRTEKKLSEKESFYYFVQACNAVHFLHKHKLMHRDIKPENMLITAEGQLKLCDFGCCTFYDSGERKTFCGTLDYMAPEVLKRDTYKEKADVWSLGVLLYEMLHGYAPFRGMRDQDTMQQIIEDKLVFEDYIKSDTREIIKAMIRTDPRQRPSIVELFEMPWIKRAQKEFAIEDRRSEMANESMKTSATSRTFIASNKSPEYEDIDLENKSIKQLKEEYDKDLIAYTPLCETTNGNFNSNDHRTQTNKSQTKAVEYLDDEKPQVDIDKCIKDLEEENNFIKRICNDYMNKKEATEELPIEILYNYSNTDYKESMDKIAKSIRNMNQSDFPSSIIKPSRITLIRPNKTNDKKKSALSSVINFLFSVDEIKGV